jgi:hypothetical protein
MDIPHALVEGGAIRLVQMVQLLHAKFASLITRDAQVLRKYENSIILATRAGFFQDGASLK